MVKLFATPTDTLCILEYSDKRNDNRKLIHYTMPSMGACICVGALPTLFSILSPRIKQIQTRKPIFRVLLKTKAVNVCTSIAIE